MNTVLLLLLLPHIIQSAPNVALFLEPPQDAAESLNATSTFSPSLAQPTPTDEVAFLLPVPNPSPPNETAPLVMAYYPDWAASSFPPEKVDFDRFDWIDFAFALPTKDFNLTWDDPDVAPTLLAKLVDAAHLKEKKVKLSLGGWTGSQHFSSAVSTNQSRGIFVDNIRNIYNQFDLDGIDIDWEYPGHQGEGDNEVCEYDSANFLSFLQLLRIELPPSAAITAAVLTMPFYGSDGEPMRNVSQFANVLDWILLMNYDVWGASANPGPNAPLSDACNNSSQPEANAVAALVLGVPSYGYASNAATRDRSVHLNCDGDQIQFRSLEEQGALVRGPDGAFSGGGGFTRCWDECSSTPFLRSPSTGQVVTYDDPQSLGMKAAFAKRVGMLGVNMFDVHGDTDGWDMIDSVRRELLTS
ncbi:glycoside hydrolase [Mycena leptocephala]|nr:glycoside hydrolase [Mycena leptocephala]